MGVRDSTTALGRTASAFLGQRAPLGRSTDSGGDGGHPRTSQRGGAIRPMHTTGRSRPPPDCGSCPPNSAQGADQRPSPFLLAGRDLMKALGWRLGARIMWRPPLQLEVLHVLHDAGRERGLYCSTFLRVVAIRRMVTEWQSALRDVLNSGGRPLIAAAGLAAAVRR
jgi:hypothetical protein